MERFSRAEFTQTESSFSIRLSSIPLDKRAFSGSVVSIEDAFVQNHRRRSQRLAVSTGRWITVGAAPCSEQSFTSMTVCYNHVEALCNKIMEHWQVFAALPIHCSSVVSKRSLKRIFSIMPSKWEFTPANADTERTAPQVLFDPAPRWPRHR